MFTCRGLLDYRDAVARAGPDPRGRSSTRTVRATPCSDGTTPSATSTPTRCRFPSTPTTWPTSCTRRARPDLPKGVLVRHRNVAMIPNGTPRWTGAGWLHGAPLFTFAGMSFIYNPMKMGLTGLYMPKFDVDHWFDVVEHDKPMMIFLVPAMAELVTASARFETADLSAPIAVSIGSRAARARDVEAAAGPHAAGVGVELVRPHRGRSRVHRDAEGRPRAQAGLGRQADAADGDQGRRSRHRRRRVQPTRSASCSCACPASAASTTRTTARPRARGPTTVGSAPATSRTSTTKASSTSRAASRT